ncbi:hypothetical protein [Actinophytocola sediminis]
MNDTDDRLRKLLAGALEDRADELGKNWRQIAGDGGISYETVRAARKGDSKRITAQTRRALERGLEWDVRYIDQLLVKLRRQAADELDAPAEPVLRDDVERDLWRLAESRDLGERGAWLLINAYRGDQLQPSDSDELGQKKTG